MRFWTTLFIFINGILGLLGQVNPTTPGSTVLEETEKFDTSNNEASNKLSDKVGNFGILKAFSGNPGKAALYSAIIPSAGQIYNKNYWKVPIVLAAEGTAIFLIIDNGKNFREWRQAHIEFAAGERTEFRGATTTSQARRVRDQFEQFRDFSIIGTAAIHLIQIADAFIHRHLIEFDVSDDLSINAFSNGQSFSMVLTF